LPASLSGYPEHIWQNLYQFKYLDNLNLYEIAGSFANHNMWDAPYFPKSSRQFIAGFTVYQILIMECFGKDNLI
jgi:hypothetical protein